MAFINISPIAATLLLFALNIFNVKHVWGHGMVLEPTNRASLFRFEEFKHLNPPKNYQDNELWCGGVETQYTFNGGKCGICGDPYNETVPRTHEDGGENYIGNIVRGYRSGELMPVVVNLTVSHFGYFEFRLCAMDDTTSHLNQECYDQHLLTFVNETTGERATKYTIPVRGEVYLAQYSLELPKGISCKHCVLQWHYWTHNRWGNCSDGTEGLHCGNQEVFRGCSDITVYPEDTAEENIDRKPSSNKFEKITPENETSSAEFTTDNGIDLATNNTTITTSSVNRTKLSHFDTFHIRYYNRFSSFLSNLLSADTT